MTQNPGSGVSPVLQRLFLPGLHPHGRARRSGRPPRPHVPPTWGRPGFLLLATPFCMGCYRVVLICISMTLNGVEPPFMCSSFAFSILICRSSSYILDTKQSYGYRFNIDVDEDRARARVREK